MLVSLVLRYTRAGCVMMYGFTIGNNLLGVFVCFFFLYIGPHVLFLLVLHKAVRGSSEKQFEGMCQQQFGNSKIHSFQNASCYIDGLH